MNNTTDMKCMKFQLSTRSANLHCKVSPGNVSKDRGVLLLCADECGIRFPGPWSTVCHHMSSSFFEGSRGHGLTDFQGPVELQRIACKTDATSVHISILRVIHSLFWNDEGRSLMKCRGKCMRKFAVRNLE